MDMGSHVIASRVGSHLYSGAMPMTSLNAPRVVHPGTSRTYSHGGEIVAAI